jgi:hypothetical protein
MTPVIDLRAGDILLYRPSSWVGWVIAIKTASRAASHVEVAVKPGIAIAARRAGVNYYGIRWEHLSRVLRPNKPLDLSRALDWFDKNARGQRYDYVALGRFFIIPGLKQSTDKQICSELATRFLRAGAIGWKPFGGEDADLVEPRDFLKSGDYDEVWSDGKP